MALSINGTTGISGVDGSASAPALQGTDSNTGINFGTDTVNINTGGSTRATVDSTGNLLINSPSGSLSHKLQVESDSNANGIAILGRSSDDIGELSYYENDGSTKLGELQFRQTECNFRCRTGHISFAAGGTTERMRINSDGDVLIGTTSLGSTNAYFEAASSSRNILYLGCGSTANSNVAIFMNPNGNIGFIRTNGSSTSYETSSDYRLKENQVAISDGITRLKTLKPYRFNFKADATTTVDGFFAHEAATAVPEAVSGTKDEVVTQAMIDAGDYKEGTLNDPVHQGIDQSKLVPLLTAALQEAVAKIEVLETKVAALEAG